MNWQSEASYHTVAEQFSLVVVQIPFVQLLQVEL